MLFLKNILFTIFVPGTVAVLLPAAVLSLHIRQLTLRLGAFHWAGVAVALAGFLIYLWCVGGFAVIGKGTPAPIDPPKELVSLGLYSYSRNPMYIGVLSVILGEAVYYESGALFLFALLIFLLFNAFVFLYEEPTLRKKFGDSYIRYCASVPRWFGIPAARKTRN